MSKDAHQRPPRRPRYQYNRAPQLPIPLLARARVAKSVDARDLKSLGFNQPCRFESGSGHQWNSFRKSRESYFTRNHASLTDPAEVGALLRAIDGYEGQSITAAALKLAPLVFVRPRELRGARWVEFDLDGGEWPHCCSPGKKQGSCCL